MRDGKGRTLWEDISTIAVPIVEELVSLGVVRVWISVELPVLCFHSGENGPFDWISMTRDSYNTGHFEFSGHGAAR